jgi:hypothetical protein
MIDHLTGPMNLADLGDNDNPSNGDDPMREQQEEARRESAPGEENAQPQAADASGRAEGNEKVKYFGKEKERRQSGNRQPTSEPPPEPIDFTKHAVSSVECPLDLLPKIIRDFVVDTTFRLQCAPDLVAIPALVAAGGMLGRVVRVQPKCDDPTWTERPAIWGAVVAPPSSMKSPAQKAAMSPVTGLQKRLFAKHQDEEASYKADFTQYKGDCKTAPKNDKPLPPEKPGPVEVIELNDTTTERAAQLMAPLYNPNERGILVNVDELSGLLTSFNQYKNGKGNDRQFWLKAWGGGAHNQQRVRTEGSFYIPECYASIFGGIQPEVAQTLFGSSNDDDGLVQRFGLVVMPDNPDKVVPRGVAPKDDVLKAYKHRILELHNVPEQLVKFSREASSAFDQWEADTRNDAINLRGSPFGSHIGKYTALAPRLALVWHFVEHRKDAPAEISLETFNRVRRFIDGYLKPHASRLYGTLSEHACKPAAMRVAEWILKERPVKFTARDIRRKGWSEFNREKDDAKLIAAVLNFLEAMNWIELREEVAGPRGGRPTTVAYVNPRVFEEFADGLGK